MGGGHSRVQIKHLKRLKSERKYTHKKNICIYMYIYIYLSFELSVVSY